MAHAKVRTPEAELEPGDRFELALTAADGRVTVPDFLRARPELLGSVEGPAGRPLKVRGEPAAGQLVVPDLGRLEARPEDTLGLEYQGDERFRLLVVSPRAVTPTRPCASPVVPTGHRNRGGWPVGAAVSSVQPVRTYAAIPSRLGTLPSTVAGG